MQDESKSETPIALCGDLTQFFGEIVTSVKQRRAYDASDATATYIAALLADHAHGVMPVGTFDKPLTLQLADALNQVGTERFARLRRIGDGILYTTGFFGEHFERRGIEQSYVEELGARAYATAGRMMAMDRREANGLFDELAQHFHMFVALVHEVADSLRAGAARTETALLELYERWLNSHSESLASALASRGLVPLRGVGTVQ